GGEDDQSPLSIDVSNGDLGVLIGRRGQTLASLQYLVNIIIGRKLKSGVRVIVDVAGYRKRRDEELQNMTLRVAELVKSTRRSITLEPMPAMERRVVHLALRDDPELATQSVGFGDSRKVVVYPKRQREQY
ncbi:KH domain-containing protein, partial [Dehalococcoidia bacterium]|nr:KH domain-containing protein [Dehalococcoidia bacterium]